MSERRLAEALLARVDADWTDRMNAYIASFGAPCTDVSAQLLRGTYGYKRLELGHAIERLKVEMMASVPIIGRLWLLGKLRGSS